MGTPPPPLLNTLLPSFGASWVCQPRIFSHVSGVYHLDGQWFSFARIGLSSYHCVSPLMVSVDVKHHGYLLYHYVTVVTEELLP